MLTIIIVTYNSSRSIASCLQSVFNDHANIPLNVILVDNASADKTALKETLEMFSGNVSRTRGDVVLLENDQNQGFAKAVNQGIRYALEKYAPQHFLLLNPDAELGTGCLAELLCCAKTDEKRGLISASILQPGDKTVWFSQGHINWVKMKTQHDNDRKVVSHPSQASLSSKLPPILRQTLSTSLSQALIPTLRPTPYLTGCCLMIGRDVIEKIGLLDERFFLYYEDADYSVRAQQAGFSLITSHKAMCYHAESQSSSHQTKNYHLCKSGIIFFHKHLPAYTRPYFWSVYWFRRIYHRRLSGKKEVYAALKDAIDCRLGT